MRGHNVYFCAKLRKIIPFTPSDLEHCKFSDNHSRLKIVLVDISVRDISYL